MIHKRMIPMAQSKYILATYNPKPGRFNKHWIILPAYITVSNKGKNPMIDKRMIPMAQSKYVLATYSPKPGRVNKHRIISHHILATYRLKARPV